MLKRAFKKYGFENFKVELIEWCDSLEELDEREIYWIKYYDATNSECFYNLARGGGTGWSYVNSHLDLINRNYEFSEIHKKHISESRIKKGTAKGENNPNYGKRGEKSILHGKICIHKDTENRYIKKEELTRYVEDGWLLGKSEDIGKNISKSVKGRTYTMPDYQRQAISNALKGKPKSKESVEKGRQKKIGKKRSPEAIEKFKKSMIGKTSAGKIGITNGEKNKYVKPEELDKWLSEGWRKGATNPNQHTNTGMKAVHKDDKYKMVFPYEIEQYLSEGWKLGRLWKGEEVIREDKEYKKDKV